MLADEDWQTLITYVNVLSEMNGEPKPEDGAATLRAMAAKYGG